MNAQEYQNILYNMIGHGNEAIAKAARIRNAQYKQAQAVESVIPDVLTALVDNRRIAAGDTIKVASLLRDPVTALQLLKEVAGHNNQPSSNIGRTYKAASARGTTRQDRLYEIENEFMEGFNC